jgi:hypothetical protein
MNRRMFIALVASLPAGGCTAFRIGWLQGGLCSREAAKVKFDYVKNEVAFVGVLKISRIRAETEYLKSVKRGLAPRSGAVVKLALQEANEYVRFMKKAKFKMIGSLSEIQLYKTELTQGTCVKTADAFEWREGFQTELEQICKDALGTTA